VAQESATRAGFLQPTDKIAKVTVPDLCVGVKNKRWPNKIKDSLFCLRSHITAVVTYQLKPA
jgi:hypothetical protein